MEISSVSSIILIVLGAVEVLAGLASIITGKVYMMSGANMYTEESLLKFARPYGLTNLCAGAGIILYETVKTPLFGSEIITVGLIALVVLGISAITIYFVGKKALVKVQK